MLRQIILKFLRIPSILFEKLFIFLPYFKFIRENRENQCAITFQMWFIQQILGINRGPYWPIHHSSLVSGWPNIYAGIDTCPGLMPGCYIQAIGKIYIGDYTQIAPNVGIISANHSTTDTREHVANQVIIGKYCWIGMGAIILPGVTLGDFTIVGAGAIVTKSFPEGYCVIAGNPARKIKTLTPESCKPFTNRHKYNGYIKNEDFEEFRKKFLLI